MVTWSKGTFAVLFLCAICSVRVFADDPSVRAEVPTSIEQSAASKNIREIFAREIEDAKNPEKLRALAEKWISVAEQSSDDNPSRYMLLVMAKELLVPQGDVDRAAAVVERLDEYFIVAKHSLKSETFSDLAKYVQKNGRLTLGNRSLASAKHALLEMDFKSSEEMANIALAMSKKEKNLSLARRSTLFLKRIEATRSGFADVKNAMSKIESSPTDPAANHIVGVYYCLELEDWDSGIANLALSNDLEIGSCAKAELQLLRGIGDSVGVADAWWTLSSKYRDYQGDAIRNHAAVLYRASIDGVAELERMRIEERLATLHVKAQQAEWWKLVDAKRNSIVGEWSIKNGELYSPESRDVSGITTPNIFQLPHEVRDSYTVEMQVSRLGGKRNLMIGLVHKRGLFVVSIDCGQDGLSTGLGNLDGRLANDNPTTVRGPILTPGKQIHVICEVTPEMVTITIDKRRIIQWTGDVSRWSLKDGPFGAIKLEPGRLFLAADVFSQFVISEINVR